MTDLQYTSLPPWARGGAAATGPAPALGRSNVWVGIGAAGAERVAAWGQELDSAPGGAQLPGADLFGTDAPTRPSARTVTLLIEEDGERAAERLTAVLRHEHVGVRVRVAGPSGACLLVRAAAVRAGLVEEELHVEATALGQCHVRCVHCGATTATDARPEEVIPCDGCGLNLLVHHHVSRRSGRFLGFQADAEAPYQPGHDLARARARARASHPAGRRRELALTATS